MFSNRRLLVVSALVLLSVGGISAAQPLEPGFSLQADSSIHFAIIGDYGYGSQGELDVANRVKSWNPEFIITTGDNNYPTGSASTIDQNIGQYYHDFIHPYTGTYGSGAVSNLFFPSLGNHDWDSSTNAQPYLNYFTLPGNERYYDFIRGPVHFFAIDSDGREPDGISSTSSQAVWLQGALGASTSTWNLVYMHHPPYSSGGHGSTPTLQWPYATWGADVVLAGHEHDYERIFRNGISYIVNGLGGAPISAFGTTVSGSQVRYNSDYGAMLVDAGETQITFQFITRTGTIVDTYALDNSPTATPTTTGTSTLTRTPTVTFTNTVTRTPTNTATRTPTLTPSRTPTYTLTYTATSTSPGSATSTRTSTATKTATFTPTTVSTATQTRTSTGTATSTSTPPLINTSTKTPTLDPANPPGAATLMSPFGNIAANYTPTYIWNEVPGADWYYLWINGPSGKVLAQWYQASTVCSGNSCSITPAITLGGGAYSWWVQTWNPAGYGPWSAGVNFSTAPLSAATLISPTGNLGATYSPSFVWNQVSGATYYYLYINGPSGKLLDLWYQSSAICNSGTCTVVSPVTLGGGAHTWWVQTWNSAGYGPWSTGMNFSLPVPKPPIAATLLSPSGSITTTQPTYTWNVVLDSAQGDAATWYYLWVNGPSGKVFAQWYQATAICNSNTCSINPGLTLGNGAYTWWIQTWNSAGYGPWSSARNFTISP